MVQRRAEAPPQPRSAERPPIRPAAPDPGVWGKFMQFAVVGLGNAAVDLGALNVFLLIWPTTSSLVLTLENSLAVALAIANSYFWNARWTFRREADGSFRQAALFVLQSLVNIGLNDGILLLTAGPVSRLDLGPAWVSINLAKGAAMLVASTASFTVMRLFVFRPRT